MPVQSAARGEGDQQLRHRQRGEAVEGELQSIWRVRSPFHWLNAARLANGAVLIAVYVYRLAIEYARLWADDRAKMSYKG